MDSNIKKICVEVACVVVRNLLNMWRKEALKTKKKN